MVNEEAGKAAEPLITTADDIIREAVTLYPGIPHDEAVLKWLSQNYPEYTKIYQKASAKYDRMDIGDVALHYAVTEMIENSIKGGGTGPPYLTLRETILLLFIMVVSLSGAMFLLWTVGYYGLIAYAAVGAAIIGFFLALERGLIGRKSRQI